VSEPASRQQDLYLCGQHGLPGVVAEPSRHHVYITERVAARYTDPCQCMMGDAALIKEGAAQVLIGGLPAARRGVETVDGGQVLLGEPMVLIGGDLFSLPPCISIDSNDAAFQAKVLADLYKIGSTESGQALFASIEASGRTWTICPGPPPDSSDPNSVTRPDSKESEPASTDGTGTNATTYFNPDHKSDDPSDSTLFHEGMHADDITNGTADTQCYPNPGGCPDPCRGGELRAVGLPPYNDPNQYPYSQNTYNQERGYPTHSSYGKGPCPPTPGGPCRR
jgi:uncharacterized Zn-binding protein involved in type VI secretion